MKALCSSLFLALSCAAPALASITVSSPAVGASVTSPFSLSATASACSSQPIASMGYSLDTSSTTITVQGGSIRASVAASSGSHSLHVKAWGTGGAACTSTVNITVVKAATTSTNVAVSSPSNGASVHSPFSLQASGTLCQGHAITAMGYSLDQSATTITFNGTALNTNVTASTGSHALHVKSWGSGVSCVTTLSVNVTAAPGPTIPSNATAIQLIQKLTNWTAVHDAGTSGTSSGSTSLVSSPSLSGSARKFATSYKNYGGERYNIVLPLNQTSTNFVYDTQIYLASPSSDISNLEMDLNQVMPNGQTVIFGFQCDIWSHTWDYTKNAGTPANPDDRWMHSNQTCDLHKWSTNTWHHVQIQYSRDSSGNVTYQSVWLDGVKQDINVTVPSAFALGWGPSLSTNLQIGGYTSTSGSSTIYLDHLTLYRW